MPVSRYTRFRNKPRRWSTSETMLTCVPGQTRTRPCFASATRSSNHSTSSSRYVPLPSVDAPPRSLESYTETRLLLRTHPHPHLQRLRRRRRDISCNTLICVPIPRHIVTGHFVTGPSYRVFLQTSLLDGVFPTPPRGPCVVTCSGVHPLSLFPRRAIADEPTPRRVLDARGRVGVDERGRRRM